MTRYRVRNQAEYGWEVTYGTKLLGNRGTLDEDRITYQMMQQNAWHPRWYANADTDGPG